MKYKMSNLKPKTIKQIKDLLPKEFTKENIDELIELYFNVYCEKLEDTGMEFNEDEFLEFCLDCIDSVKDFERQSNEILEDMSKSKLIQFKVSLSTNKDNYRIIQIPNIYSLNSLSYAILAAYDLMEPCEYVLHYNNNDFFNKSMSYDENRIGMMFDEDMFFLHLDLEENDELFFVYDEQYEFEIEVLNICDNTEESTDILMIKKHGIPLFTDFPEMFELLDKNQIEEFDRQFKDHVLYDIAMDKYIKRNRKISKTNFNDMIDDIFEIYNMEIDDEFDDDEQRMDFYEEREIREKELMKLPHIKEYNYAKNLFEKVISKLSDYLDENFEEIKSMENEYLLKKRNNKLPEQIKLESVKLSNVESHNLFMNYIFPVGPGFTSVSEIFKENKKLVLEESFMLDSIIDYKFGLYKIIGFDLDNAIILIEDIITKQEFEIIDMNLSFGLSREDNWPMIAGRIVIYNTRAFLGSAIFLQDDELLEEYIEKIKNHPDYKSIDFFTNTVIISNKQKANF